jgi:putative heme-binding domain-containing protein
VAGAWQDRLSDPIEALAPMVVDDHPRVRLEAVRALALVPDPRAAEVALRALARPIDTELDYALYLTARETAPLWMPRVLARESDLGGPEPLAFALLAVGSPEVIRPLMTLVGTGELPGSSEPEALALIGRLGEPDDLRRVFDASLDPSKPADRRARLLGSLASAARERKVRPSGSLDEVATIVTDPETPAAVRAAAARAAGAWGLDARRSGLSGLATEAEAPALARRAALAALAESGGDEARRVVAAMAEAGPPEVRAGAIEALAAFDLSAAADRAVAALAEPGTDPVPVVAALSGRQGGPQALAAALDGVTLPGDAAKLAVRAARSAPGDASTLIDALNRAGGLGGGPGMAPPGQVASLVAGLRSQGDPARGERVFRRDELQCIKCHAIAGAGGKVGPGLESIGASAPDDYLVESLLIPEKAIKEGYHSLIVATDDGRILTGIPIREADGSLVLRDAEGLEVAVSTASIEERAPGNSLMPAGLVDPLTRPELLDLLAFLSALGEPGPYAVGTEVVARSWEVVQADGPAGDAIRRIGVEGAIEADDPRFSWQPVTSLVSGALPTDALPAVTAYRDASPLTIARTGFETESAGPIRVRLSPAVGVSAWLDGRPVSPADSIDLEVGPGRHSLTLVVDRGRSDGPLRVTFEDVPGSAARPRPVVAADSAG